AITRARNRCYIYVPERIKESPLDRLIQPTNSESAADRIRSIAVSCLDSISVSPVRFDFREKTLPGSDAEKTSPPLAARPFTGKVSQLAITASFSALNVTESELNDSDAIISEEIGRLIPSFPDESDLSIFTFDRGRRTGDFFHDVLEQMDFQNLDGLSELLESRLGIHGFFQTLHRPAINEILQQLMQAELEPGMSLCNIPMQDRPPE